MEYYKAYHESSNTNYVKHHGIKGMKWGVRRTPEQLGYRKNQNGKTKYRSLSTNIHREDRKLLFNNAVKTTVSFMLPPFVSAAWYADGLHSERLTDKYYNRKNSTVDRIKEKYNKNHPILKLNQLKTGDPLPPNKAYKNVNPLSFIEKHKPKLTAESLYETIGRSRNCANCCITYDLKRRGYDVKSRTDTVGMSMDMIAKYYPKSKVRHVPCMGQQKDERVTDYIQRGYNNLIGKISSQGPNARGIVGVTYYGCDMGHVLNYENDSKGNTHFYDCQNGLVNRKTDKIFAVSDPKGYDLVRTDNSDISNNITKCVESEE